MRLTDEDLQIIADIRGVGERLRWRIEVAVLEIVEAAVAEELSARADEFGAEAEAVAQEEGSAFAAGMITAYRNAQASLRRERAE